MRARRKPLFPPAHYVLLTGLVLGLAAFASGGRAADPSAPPIDRLIDFRQNRYGLPPPEFDYDAAGPLGPVTLGGRPAWRTSVDLFAPSPKFVLTQASAQPGAEHFSSFPVPLSPVTRTVVACSATRATRAKASRMAALSATMPRSP